MTERELFYTLALTRTPNIGDINAKKLISRCGSAPAVLKASKKSLRSIEGIGDYTLKQLGNAEYYKAAEAELKYIQNKGVEVLYYLDEAYPERLKHCLDGPVLLFQKGNVNLKESPVLSIVGTRKMTSYGRAFCINFLKEIAILNPVIVSGFAYGVDITAQLEANNLGLQTIGCLAHGLDIIYPKVHGRYMKQMESNGGFLTDFWSNSQPERENFLKRNRIIAGVSEAVLVVESAEKGGSLVTADIALSYNRDVFAVPGRSSDIYSQGCNNLIKQQKAQMITSAADLIYLMGWNTTQSKKTRSIQKRLFFDFNNGEKLIYDYLKEKGRQPIDLIALNCALPVHETSGFLLQMELKGAVRPLPGRIYESL